MIHSSLAPAFAIDRRLRAYISAESAFSSHLPAPPTSAKRRNGTAPGSRWETFRRAFLLGGLRKSLTLIDRPEAQPIRSLCYFAEFPDYSELTVQGGRTWGGCFIGLGIITGCLRKRQHRIIGTVSIGWGLQGGSLSQRLFSQIEIGVQIDIDGLDGLMAEPQR